MHIGFDAKRYFLNATGLGNYSRTTVRLLHTYFPENDYYLYTPRTSDRSGILQPGEHVHVRTPGLPTGRMLAPLWRTFLLGRETTRDALDIFHGLSHEIPYGLPQTTKKVVTMHDLIFLRHPELYNRLDVAVYTAKYRSSCSRSDTIIAISQQTKRDLIEFFNMDEHKIKVVYQSCDKRFYDRIGDDTRQTIRKKHDLPSRYILYVGSLAERKNVITLIHALGRIPRESRPHLVLVGTGNRGYMTRLHAAIAQEHLDQEVTWLGQVPGKDLPGIYQMADLFVYPSLFEGFGIPILEALFSKTPVITSTGSCFREAGGPHCLYTTPGDVDELSQAIARVLDDSNLAATMRDKGYEHALHFHEHQVAKNMMNVYTSLLP
ncbi:glycosyltransferase family 4 protein [Desulfoplanes formicivorans]|uniref:Group 1 glycosyl transferase n=1 Tax=Desulfoplanes formicivorans TaxID=1592317 RepID=A0A194AEX2_9BACT|nr:glycosyltransferase family 1 protein [Desulfoplanes formicivorans]GAU07641.1 group 1 glycosyl transferase [Desulfoplanes formicivorans]